LVTLLTPPEPCNGLWRAILGCGKYTLGPGSSYICYAAAEREEVAAVEDFIKLVKFLAAAYGACVAVSTVWRLGADLFG
jgi:hypothetical protein